MMIYLKQLSCWITVTWVIATVMTMGCGSDYPKTVKVKGRVMLDGQPLPNVMVTFMPTNGSRSATGFADDNGDFSNMSTFLPNDGVVPGDHQIGINPQDAPPMGGFVMEDMDGNVPELKVGTSFPTRYNVPASSGITATVEPRGANEFVFELKSK